mgnify:CR=1 FL=1
MKGMCVAACAMCLLICGCSVGDKFDQLKVTDGKGRILLLKHNIGDTYFIQDISTPPETENGKTNQILEERLRIGKN